MSRMSVVAVLLLLLGMVSGCAVGADKPAANQPAADQPAADRPAADQPAADRPAADRPAADRPAADQPAANQPAADKVEKNRALVESSRIEQQELTEDNPDTYRLHQGDTVLVSVWREDALRTQAVVLPDGSIAFPLVGRIEVAGFSTLEVERRITAKLKKYIPDPVVTVVIAGIDGNRAYVMGKVVRPGHLIISGPITVLQAISIVGGLDKFADEGGIKVIRTKSDAQEILSVDYKNIISGKSMSTNIQLKAGDTIVVP